MPAVHLAPPVVLGREAIRIMNEGETAFLDLGDKALQLSRPQIEKMYEYTHTVEDPSERQTIYAYDDEGWVLVGNADPENADEVEGDGVWTDREGREHQGPVG